MEVTNVRARLIIAMGVLLVGLLLLATQCPNGSSSPIVVLNASPTSGTSPLTVSFDASSSLAPEGSTIMCEWVFGDGETDTTTTETISHTYLHPGTYTAELTGRDTEGNSDSDSCTITVTAAVGTPPSAGFTAIPSSGEVPLAVTLNASASSDPDGSITSYAWSFDDGGSGSGVIVTHTYTSAGTYYPLLCVTDDDGNQDYAAQTVRVLSSSSDNNPPSASFTASSTSGQAPLAVSFNGSGSSDSDGSISSYAWSFGDGGSSSGSTTSHTYSSVGTYTARLTVTDDDGATDATTRTIQVSATPVANNPPSASFTASSTSGQAPLAVSFNGSGSSDSDGSISSYAWSFGDGGSSSGSTTSHTYSSVGTYTARLTVTDDDGATDSTTTQIEVTALSVPEDLYADANSGSDTTGDGTQGNPYKTITKALEMATVGSAAHTIHVAAGIYSAALGEVFPLILVNAELQGEGISTEDVKIAGSIECGNNSVVEHLKMYDTIVVASANTVKISTLAITTTSSYGYGIDVASSHNVEIDGCSFEDFYPTAIRVSGGTGQIKISNCSVSIVPGDSALGAIEATDVPNLQITNLISVGGTVTLLGTTIAVMTGSTITSGDVGNPSRVSASGVCSVTLEDNTLYAIGAGENASVVARRNNVEDRVTVGGQAEVLLEYNNLVGPNPHAAVSKGIRLTDEGVIDLGGGPLGSRGGNTITGKDYNLYDERTAFSGVIHASGNTWDNPQPSGTAVGPADNPTNYFIEREGNSIIFSD